MMYAQVEILCAEIGEDVAAEAQSAVALVEVFAKPVTGAVEKNTAENQSISGVLEAGTAFDVTLIDKPEKDCPVAEMSPSERVQWDCNNLTKTQLRKKYQGEANCHSSMMARRKTHGALVHPALQTFIGFLRIMGRKPIKQATVDRINNDDPEYAPGKVRWADKRTQNSNKGDSHLFVDPKTFEVFTTARLAKMQGVKLCTIRKRLARGWSDAEIIAGVRNAKASAAKEPLSSLEPGPIFPPLPGEFSWSREMKKAKKAEDYGRIFTLKVDKQKFDELSARHRAFRKANPGCHEDLLLPLDVLNDRLSVIYGYEPMIEGEWLEHFADDWRKHKSHIIFERCSPYHQRAIEVVDPEYVRRHREALAKIEKTQKPQ